MRWWYLSLSLLCAVVVGSVRSEAVTRVGLFATAEEVAIWRGRANGQTGFTGSINGFTYQSIYQNRILPDANAFRNSPLHPGGDGYWIGNDTGGCNPTDDRFGPMAGGTGYNYGNGAALAQSAFVFLLTGDLSYANPVRAELVNQISVPGTNFTNTLLWCGLSYTNNIIILPWVIRLLIAYDYLNAGGYAGFSAQEHTNIKAWFTTVVNYWHPRHVSGATGQGYAGIYSTPQDLTCSGSKCTQNTGPLYLNGPNLYQSTRATFPNGSSLPPLLSTLVGIVTNNATFIAQGKAWFQAFIRAGIFDSGAATDYIRWADCDPPCPGSMWSHAAGMTGGVVAAADALARTGDTSLYDLTGPSGVPSSGGTVVGLHTYLNLMARMASNAVQLYGTTNPAQANESTRLRWNPPNGELGNYQDMVAMAANMYYKDPAITAGMVRTAAGSNTNGPNGCWDNGTNGCYMGIYGWWPDLPLMYGNLQGTLNPYDLSGTGTTAPTCTVTAPTTLPFYETTAASLSIGGVATDSDGSISSVAIACSPGCGTPTDSGADQWTGTLPALVVGTTTVTVTVTDNAALTGTCQLSVRRQAATDTTGLEMHLALNDGAPSTTAADATGKGHTGTLSGTPTWVTPGAVGSGALSFDAAADTVLVTGRLGNPQALTIEGWFKLPAVPIGANWQTLVSLGDSVGVRVYNTALEAFWYDGTTYVTLSAPWTPNTTWHNFALTWKNGEQLLYLDGVPRALSTAAGTISYTAAANTALAVSAAGGSFPFTGTLDNIRIWTRALTGPDLVAANAVSVPPTVTITSPTTAPTYDTSVTPLAIGGRATDDISLSTVTWTCATCVPTSGTITCPSTACTGTPTTRDWTTAPIGFGSGPNVVTFVAQDGDGQQSTPAILTVNLPSPTACYTFDATTADATGLGHGGQLQGGATYTTVANGKVQQALILDGAGDYVSVAHAADLNLTGDLTIDFFGKFAAVANNNVIVSKIDLVTPFNAAFHLEIANAGTPRYAFYQHEGAGVFSGFTFTGYTVPTNTWHHVAVTRNTNPSTEQLKLFINGSLVQTLLQCDTCGAGTGWTDNPGANTSPMYIGVEDGFGADKFLNGSLDELCLYNYIVSDSAIAARAARTTGASPPPSLTIFTGSTVTTSSLVPVSGVASDDVGVTSVTASCSPSCGSPTVTCTPACGASATSVSWSVNVPLQLGPNFVTIAANDAVPSSTSDQLTLTFVPALTNLNGMAGASFMP